MTEDALSSVLLQTLVATGEHSPVDQRLIDALALTVSRRRGQEFLPEPVATEWVQEVLQSYFGKAEVWSAMASPVARKLCEDPLASANLRALWDRLQEVKT